MPSPSPRQAPANLAFALAASIVLVTLFNALNLSTRLAQTSDSVQSFLAGHAVANGNLLLSGWHFPFDDYYFTDTIPYAALEWLTGPKPFLLAFVPALAYALFVCTAFVACVRPARQSTDIIDAGAVVALMLAAPAWIGDWNPLFLSNMHFASVTGGLIALMLCARIVDSGRRNAWTFGAACAGLVAIVALTLASDPFSLVFAFAPALAVLAFDALRNSAAPRERLPLVLLAAGVALGLLLPPLIAAAGGFTTENVTVAGAIPFSLLGRNLIALLAGILSLFGANPFATDFSPLAILGIGLHALALALAAIALVRAAGRLFMRDGVPLLDRLLCAGTLSVLAACAASVQFGKGIAPETLWSGGPPMRYAMPAVLFAGVLGARLAAQMLSRVPRPMARTAARAALIAVAASIVIVSGWRTAAQPHWLADNPPATVANWLAHQRFREGVGEYWAANLITAVSGDAVHVRSVVPDDGKLAPYVLSADGGGYARPAQFVIWQDRNKTAVTAADVYATYPVCRTFLIAGFRVAVLRARDSIPISLAHLCVAVGATERGK